MNLLKATRMTSNENAWKLYLNGMGFRAIERVKHIHHTTIIYWVKQLGDRLPDAPADNNIPEVTELDELQTFVGSKKTKSGYGLL